MKTELPYSHIIIVTTASMPLGLASTARIRSYCQGFEFYNVTTTIYVFKTTESYQNPVNIYPSGKIGNLSSFRYTNNTTIRSKRFILRRFQDLFGFLNLFVIIEKQVLSANHPQAIIFYGHSFITEFFLIFYCKLRKLKILKEESEHPCVRFNIISIPFYNKLYTNLIYRRYSLLLLIMYRTK